MTAILIVLDSVGVGSAPDAAAFGDAGANTLGHILEHEPGLSLPALRRLGLLHILAGAGGNPGAATAPNSRPESSWGWMQEQSGGKDTTSGHWEIAGVVIREPFAVFGSFPPEIVEPIQERAGVRFIGNYARSGTVILDELGAEHVATGNPILYTSADSVLQIAAHEDVVPLEKLYQICRVAREIADEYRIGRVIARPFTGQPGAFRRTANRKDFSLIPPPTILNHLQRHGTRVIAIGKIGDIFAESGIDESHPTHSNEEGMTAIEDVHARFHGDSGKTENALIFANLVDFDMHYGHRRDPRGYGEALAAFDSWLETFLPKLRAADLLIITADHGNDPAWRGTDHTRELVPLLVKQGASRPGDLPRALGHRQSFADVAASLARYFRAPPWPAGKPFLE